MGVLYERTCLCLTLNPSAVAATVAPPAFPAAGAEDPQVGGAEAVLGPRPRSHLPGAGSGIRPRCCAAPQ